MAALPRSHASSAAWCAAAALRVGPAAAFADGGGEGGHGEGGGGEGGGGPRAADADEASRASSLGGGLGGGGGGGLGGGGCRCGGAASAPSRVMVMGREVQAARPLTVCPLFELE